MIFVDDKDIIESFNSLLLTGEECKNLLEEIVVDSTLLPNNQAKVNLGKLDSLKKLSSFFEINNELNENEDVLDTKTLINRLVKLCSSKILIEIIIFLFGGINSKNDDFLKLLNISKEIKFNLEEVYEDEKKDYLIYLEKNLHIIFGRMNIKELNLLFSIMNNVKLIDSSYQTSHLYLMCRNFVWKQDKILVLLEGSDFLWHKSKRNAIGGISYDTKLNMSVNIFWNNYLLKELKPLVEHSRVRIGFLSSMIEKNLKHCTEAIKIKYPYFDRKDIIYISQKHHQAVKNPNFKSKDDRREFFFRSMSLITNESKFGVTNTLIIDTDIEKINESSNTQFNTIHPPFEPFNEDSIYQIKSSPEAEILKYRSMVDIIIKRIIEASTGDIREQVVKFNSMNSK